MVPALTKGAILKLARNANEEGHADIEPPTLQIISVKKVGTTTGGPERYRLILSDGDHFMQAMASSPVNALITCQPAKLDKNVILTLTEWTASTVQNRKIIVLMAVDILEFATDKIGTPVSVEGVTDLNAAIASIPPNALAPVAPAPAVKREAPVAQVAAPAKKPKVPAGNSNTGPIYPIEGLSPYQNKWTIKARVTSKSDLRSWSNAKGDGKLFSVNLLDDSGEIKATGFTDAAEKIYPFIEEGKVYYISKARVNVAKRQYSTIDNEYEITFSGESTMELCEDQDGAPQITYTFTPLGELGGLDKDTIIDVLGVIYDNGTLSEITLKTQSRTAKKREIMIADNSGYSVKLTLWGKNAENWVDSDKGIYAFKGVKVGDFGGRTLGMGNGGSMVENPDIPEAHELRGWYDTEGASTSFNSFSGTSGGDPIAAGAFKPELFKTISQVKEERLGENGETIDYFNIRASILFVKPDNLYYPACPADRCNKKISKESEDSWRCEKCNALYPKPNYRYIINLNVADGTDSFWCSGFDNVGQGVIGVSADQMEDLKENSEDDFNSLLGKSITKMFNMSLRAKSDSYNDALRVRYSILSVTPIDWAAQAKIMLKQIESY